MKQKKYLSAAFLFFCIFFIFSGCKEDTDSLSNLVSSSWQIVGIDVYKNKEPRQDSLAKIPACKRDNIEFFAPEGTHVYDAGKTKCTPAEVQSFSDFWRYVEASTRTGLVIYTDKNKPFDPNNATYDIDKINSDNLVLKRITFQFADSTRTTVDSITTFITYKDVQ